MKKTLLSAFFTCICVFSFAQSLIPLDSFYVIGASWTEVVTTQYAPCSAGTDMNTAGIVYQIVSDSVGGGKTYHMLSSYYTGSYGGTVNCNSGFFTVYANGNSSPGPIFAMIRTDSNRVYFTLLLMQNEGGPAHVCDTVGKEELLFDFNYVIGSTDSVSLSNGVKVPSDGSLIYGIGAQDGFIDYWDLYVCDPNDPTSIGQYMLCYNNPHFNYQFSYAPGTLPDSLQYDCFDMDASLAYFDSVDALENSYNNMYNNPNSNPNSIPSPSYSFSIYPNPALDQLNITDPAAIASISIINITGQAVYSIQWDTTYFNYNQQQVDITAFPAGMYFIKVNDGKAKKFVKQSLHQE